MHVSGEYLIAHAHLEHRAILLGPFPGHRGMLIPQLQQVSEDWHSGDLGDAFDLGDVGAVEVSNNKVDGRDDRNGDGCNGHLGSELSSINPGIQQSGGAFYNLYRHSSSTTAFCHTTV